MYCKQKKLSHMIKQFRNFVFFVFVLTQMLYSGVKLTFEISRSLFHPNCIPINSTVENTKVNPNFVKLSCHSCHWCHPDPVWTPPTKSTVGLHFYHSFRKKTNPHLSTSQLQILIMCNYTPHSFQRVIPRPRGAGDTHACRSTRA